MDIAIPRAGHPDERRIALTPAGVQVLAAAGHALYVECGAGLGAGFADSDFSTAGAQIVYSPDRARDRYTICYPFVRWLIGRAAERLALPAGGRDETTPF